nr:uncharacterized protein LOC123284813 [Equus asinus]
MIEHFPRQVPFDPETVTQGEENEARGGERLPEARVDGRRRGPVTLCGCSVVSVPVPAEAAVSHARRGVGHGIRRSHEEWTSEETEDPPFLAQGLSSPQPISSAGRPPLVLQGSASSSEVTPSSPGSRSACPASQNPRCLPLVSSPGCGPGVRLLHLSVSAPAGMGPSVEGEQWMRYHLGLLPRQPSLRAGTPPRLLLADTVTTAGVTAGQERSPRAAASTWRERRC